ncbi:MAG: hypothetical protein IKS56_05695 [Lachnospiraceae bacterium]|nr:hypothetical protein [Lachnospiraceae bacterium]
MKRLKFLLLVGILACAIGCQNQNPVMVPIDDYIDKNIEEDIAVDVETTDTEEEKNEFVSAFEVGSPEYLFEQFLMGEIDAEILYPIEADEKAINVSQLNMNPEEWSFDSFSVGEQLDLDNDGENELILDGPYGGMYLDAIDGKLYVFAKALGNAGALDYTFYDGAYWIVIKDTTHGGRLYYLLYKYEGGDNLTDSMSLLGNWYSEDEKEFTFNDEPISEEEFYKIKDEIFASKTPVSQANYNLIEEKDINDYINANLVLEDDEEIEACEWVSGINESKRCFRVRICYKEEPENGYKHSRDFFVFRGSKLTSIMVDYASKDDYDAPRYVYEANDFEARLEDVNFDGYNDLLICLGYFGPNAGSYWCAYLNDGGNYVYNESFEKISNYRLESVSKVIYSSVMEQATPIDSIYKYDKSKNEFTEVCSYKGMDGEVFRVVADLIVYDKENYFDEDEQDWTIVSTFGETEYGTLVNKEGYELQYTEKMPIEDLEIFYKQVYGKDRSFEAGYEGGVEVGIFCKDDGYAYAHNGIGWGEYPVITNVEKTDKGVKVYCDLNSAFVGYRHATFNFSLIESDNKFGYSLVKDSIIFTRDVAALYDEFENVSWSKMTDEDFTFKYGDNTFSISDKWSDFADALGYPDNFEENNYGYVTTDAAGFRWAMHYPSQSDSKYDFNVVMVSPSMDREGGDTYIESITLIQTETARGIKAGDSVSDLANAYGTPQYISLHDENDEWMDVVYNYGDEYMFFVIADNKVLYIKMYQ